MKDKSGSDQKKKTERGCQIGRFFRGIIRYFIDIRQNLFHDGWDAFFGLVVLLVIPAGSLIGTMRSYQPGFLSYVFPLGALCMAGLYDSYSRYVGVQKGHIKLGIRIAFDILSLLSACATSSIGIRGFQYVSPALLLGAGTVVICDAIMMMHSTVVDSQWYSEYVFNSKKDGGKG